MRTYPDAIVSPQHTEKQLQLFDCDAVAGHDTQHVHQKVWEQHRQADDKSEHNRVRACFVWVRSAFGPLMTLIKHSEAIQKRGTEMTLLIPVGKFICRSSKDVQVLDQWTSHT